MVTMNAKTNPRANSLPPTGTLTFLFTDLEGSTRLWQMQHAAMQSAVARHDELMRQCIAARGGHVFKTVGDAFCVAFPTAPQALSAALAIQQAMHAEPWPDALEIRVRVALHTGAAEARDGDYFGMPLNHIARLLAVAHGGQTLLSEVTHGLCRDRLPVGSTLKSLGTHALDDIARPESVFQLCHPGLPASFPPLGAAATLPVVDETPSIAVLPFVNMSRDEENEYFADGLSEELMNVLSNIRGLRVPSRTSAFYFKGREVDIPTVAQKLSVATILEGSVRKSGKRVRITAQLIHVATDSHLWSRTYDRELDDIFAVQDDIAQSVVSELRAALLKVPPDRSESATVREEVQAASRGRGENAEAYRLYLQGRFLVERRTREDLAKGIGYLRQATTVDAEYALAWAALSFAYAIEAGTVGSTPYAEGYLRAREAAQRALALQPDLAEGHMALGVVRMGSDWDLPGADASMRRALELAPANAMVLIAAATLSGSRSRLDESIAFSRRAIAVDPLNVQAHRYLGMFSLRAGLLEQAEGAFKEALELNPHGGLTHYGLGMVYLEQRRLQDALAACLEETNEGYRQLGPAVAYHALDQGARSNAAIDELCSFAAHRYLAALGRAYRGELDEAFALLELAHAQRNAGLIQMKQEPLLRNLHGDPRWPLFLGKMGLAG